MTRPLPAYFALTFLLAWIWWLAMDAATAPLTTVWIRGLLFLPGTFAPAMVAIWLTWRSHGREGTRALLSGMFESRVRTRWYVFAVGYMAAVKLTAAMAHRVITGAWPAFGQEPWFLLVLAIVSSTPVQAGEEIGWRGYALPKLGARMGLARASVLLGVIWAAWHLPLFFMPGTGNTGQPFFLFLATVTALSVAMAWLYAHAGGSLLLVMLMHAAINNTTGIVPSAVADTTSPLTGSPSMMAWLTCAVMWLGAAYFLVRMPASVLPLALGSSADTDAERGLAEVDARGTAGTP